MSILAADFGSVYTRVVLIDRVEGTYQLVARAQTRTTHGFPVNDISVGLDRAMRQLSESTQRTFTDSSGQIITPENEDRQGVDYFAATASIGRPLRTVLVGLMPAVSIKSAQRATAGTYAQINAIIDLADGRSEEERLNVILAAYPDVVLIVGGTEGGAEAPLFALVNTVYLAVSLLERSRRPTVIYAGNTQIAAQVRDRFGDRTQVLIAPNLRPSLKSERLDAAQAQLAHAFDIYKEERSTAFQGIVAQSSTGVLPTAQSYNIISSYLSRAFDQRVITLDIGSAASVAAVATHGAVRTGIRTDLGLGHSADSLLETVGADAVRAWLPFPISTSELRNYAANKGLTPIGVPMDLRETYIEHALLRSAGQAVLAQAAEQVETCDLLIGAGSTLTELGDNGYQAMFLLDIVQPTGITRMMSDPFGLIPALGAISTVEPDAVVQVLDNPNSLQALGTCFSVSGQPALDQPTLRLTITLDDGNTITEDLTGGHLFVLPMSSARSAAVQVQVLRRGLDIGGKRKQKLSVNGSSGALIFDTRGRPLALSDDVATRAVQLPQWIAEASNREVQAINPEWLEQPNLNDEANETLPLVESDTAPRGGLFRRRPRTERPGRRQRGKAVKPPVDDAGLDDFDDLLADLPDDSVEDSLDALRDA